MSLNDRLAELLVAGRGGNTVRCQALFLNGWLIWQCLALPCLALPCGEVLRRCGLSQPAAPLAFAYGRQQGHRLQKTMRKPVAAEGPGRAKGGPWR
jgi:hypothetical protein